MTVVQTNGGATSEAVCPATEPYLISGGGSAASGSLQISAPATANGASFANAWFIQNDLGSGSMIAYALCSR